MIKGLFRKSCLSPKSEVRNPKSRKAGRNPKSENGEILRISDFFRPSDFGLRISAHSRALRHRPRRSFTLANDSIPFFEVTP